MAGLWNKAPLKVLETPFLADTAPFRSGRVSGTSLREASRSGTLPEAKSTLPLPPNTVTIVVVRPNLSLVRLTMFSGEDFKVVRKFPLNFEPCLHRLKPLQVGGYAPSTFGDHLSPVAPGNSPDLYHLTSNALCPRKPWRGITRLPQLLRTDPQNSGGQKQYSFTCCHSGPPNQKHAGGIRLGYAQ